MKGNHIFSDEEVKAIRALLDKRSVSTGKEKESINKYLQTYHGFYISDFSKNLELGPEEFDLLISGAAIKIHG